MRSLPCLALFAALIPISALAQLSLLSGVSLAPPSDSLEPVTAMAQSVSTVEQRAAATALMNRAADQYAMHTKGTPAHVLQISFNATASTLFPAGAGQLRETWISGQNWRWDASLGSYSLLRISSNGVAYDQQANQPLPIRLKMLANSIFAPLYQTMPRVSAMRTASVNLKGAQLTCILLSPAAGGMMPGASSSPAGRDWNEREFCIDPSSGLLHVYSEAPGMYVFYDYTNALKFHDRILPGAVTIQENGVAVVQAQLTSLTDTDASNLAPFTPTAEMKSQGPATVLFLPTQATQVRPSQNVQTGATVAPAIVHVTLDEQGNIEESELLQTSAVSAQALEAVTHDRLWAVPRTSGTAPRVREVYVRVEFVPIPSRRAAVN